MEFDNWLKAIIKLIFSKRFRKDTLYLISLGLRTVALDEKFKNAVYLDTDSIVLKEKDEE